MAFILTVLTLTFSIFITPFLLFFLVIVFLASIGKSLGVRRKYVDCLVKIFEARKRLTQRWKNIIDSYRRNLRKSQKSGQEDGSHYSYARQLAFLKLTTDPAPAENNVVEEEGDYCNEEDKRPSRNRSSNKNNKNITDDNSDTGEPTGDFDEVPLSKLRQRLSEKSSANLINKPTVPTFPPIVELSGTDDDKLFFDSMLPAVRTLSMDRKLEFRCELLRLISHYRSLENAPVHNNQPLQTALRTSPRHSSTPQDS